ncbi:MAG: hypothetical protein KDB79_12110 [Acidobacteria bacterium]|nr:hypothetical protein [Acidobacteriota bacterium]
MKQIVLQKITGNFYGSGRERYLGIACAGFSGKSTAKEKYKQFCGWTPTGKAPNNLANMLLTYGRRTVVIVPLDYAFPLTPGFSVRRVQRQE